MPNSPQPVEGYAAQLKAAADYVRDCETRWKNALQVRNRLIVDAVDSGYTGHQAARDTGLKQPHIIRILSQSEPGLTRDDVVPGA